MLQLPSSFVDIDREEMEYVEGGWSWNTLGNNLRGLYNKYSFARQALIGSGITLGTIALITNGAATYLYATIAVTLGSIAAANFVVGAIIGASAGAAIAAMGNWRLFY